MSKDMQVIEINGIKLEVDMRTARRIEELRIGDKVKVLVKDYGDNFTVHPGVIVGFEPFNALPTLVVAYAIISYSSFDLKFLHFNAKTKEGFEIIKALDDDIELSKADVVNLFDRKVAEKGREIEELKEQREYFLRQFGVYWGVYWEKIAVPKEATAEPF